LNRGIGKRALLCLGLLLLGTTGFAAGTLHTVVSNGPSAVLYNIVFLSEGYTTAQLANFRAHVTNAANALLSREPYKEYAPCMNVFAISVASAESGSDHPGYSLFRDTYFSSTYDASDRIITIPAGLKGQTRVDNLLATNMPDCDVAVLLVNDSVPGGSDGAEKTAIASVPGISDVMVHELGHVVAGLGDEYTNPYPGFLDIEEPNTTRQTNRASIKWRNWIEESTPVPTPATADYDRVIGLFEGAHYHATGWYRPKLNCTMQSQYTLEFCEVCREATVLALYRRIRPATNSTPTQRRLFPSNSNPVVFATEALRPATHNLEIDWQVNGVSVAPNGAGAITLYPATLPAGTNTIRATVTDRTVFVRTDPEALLWQTNSWTLRNNLPPVAPQVAVSGFQALPDGRCTFTLSGTALRAAVEISTNLLNWTETAICPLAAGPVSWTNSAPPGAAEFFRARVVSP